MPRAPALAPRDLVGRLLPPGPARVFRARLSRRIAFWIFLNFLVVEALVLVPSVVRQSRVLQERVRGLTTAKLEWILENHPQATGPVLMAEVEKLRKPGMMAGLRGGVLYRRSTGEVLGRFGELPRLDMAAAGQGLAGRWFPLQRAYEGVWLPEVLGRDQLLVLRHDANVLEAGLLSYVRNIVLIVLGISGFLTVITMLVVHRVVIGRVLTLRDRLERIGSVFGRGERIRPEQDLMAWEGDDELSQVGEAFNRSILRTDEEMGRRLEAERRAALERDRAENLLLNILPEPIAERMKGGEHLIAQGHEDVSVLFADIVGFTDLSTRLSSTALVALLNRVFSAFDLLSERHGLEKIKTIGDNYMVVGGVPLPRGGHAEAIAAMALEMMGTVAELAAEQRYPLTLRVGIHCGPVVAGVIGRKKFIYDLWGETVNIASRMESQGKPGRIQVTEVVRRRLEESFRFEPRGALQVRGVGEMSTYWLQEPA